MFTDVPPILFALAAALLFAVGSQFQNIGLARIEPRRGAEISIFATTIFFWLLAPLLLDGAHWAHPAVWIFVLVGLFRPSVSANLAVAAMRHLGPTLSSALSSVSPLFAAAFGVLLLGEELNWPTALGTAGVIGAMVMLARRDARIPVDWPLWALFLPMGAALVRSIGHVLTKIGMEGVPDPYFAGLVGFSVSSLVVIAAQRLRPSGRRVQWRVRDPHWRDPHWRAPYWFVAGGVLMGIAVICLNTALLNAPLIAVVPIVASSPIFTMLLSVLVFRREKLTPRIVLAVFMVVASVIFIALNR